MNAALGTGSDQSADCGVDAALCVRIDCAMRILDIGRTKLYDLIAAGELERSIYRPPELGASRKH